MITKAITSTCCRRHNTPKEYCNYKTNVHKSTSVEINSGCTGLLNSILESNADWVILGDGRDPWFPIPEH